MEIVYVEAVKMPNGEVIHFGKTLGWAVNETAPALAKPNVHVIKLK